MYFGNPVGYQTGNKVMVDSLFVKEDISSFIKEKLGLGVEVRNGIFDRLAEGGRAETAGCAERKVRIWQLHKNSSILMRFISLSERKKRGFGVPQRSDYELVYEKEVDAFCPEEIWDYFSDHVPKDYTGHGLSISDVMELVEGEESRFFYVEPTCFEEIAF